MSELFKLGVKESSDLIAKGEIKDGKTQIAILKTAAIKGIM